MASVLTNQPLTPAPTTTVGERAEQHLRWAGGGLAVTLHAGADGVVRLVGLDLGDPEQALAATEQALPLVEVGVLGAGRDWSARRYAESAVGSRAQLLDWHTEDDDTTHRLVVTSVDEATGLQLRTDLVAPVGVPAVRLVTTVTNRGPQPRELSWITSAVVAGLLPGAPLSRLRLSSAANDWLAEYRWADAGLRELLPDLNRAAHQHDPRGAVERTAHGNWSSDGWLPVGLLHDPGTSRALAWQVEHSGGWHWQVGERADGAYLAALGPTDAEHQWSTELAAGESFTTVPVSLVGSADGVQGAFAALTALRRASRRPHPDATGLPVIFNDYMNTLMGDPTTEKLLPLVAAAGQVGAEVFCIDAGWYGARGEDWWDGVGAWEPGADRFPAGIDEVLDAIRAAGMVPGLWLEPEVVGVRSPLADQLPAEAFFARRGHRVVEHGRYQLDLRHPAARRHLDDVVDRLVREHGVGYLKLDHNINIGAGTDRDALTVGEGLLGHNRAHADWLDGVLDRHPALVLENCASGGMRVDQAMLSRVQLQSTSDQQDLRRYPPIAAAAATAMLPEQAASWAYPQPEHTDDEIAFTLAGPLLGRVHLSGHLDRMSPHQLEIVTAAVRAYRGHRELVRTGLPCWPLGLPGWEDGWVSHGLHSPDGGALITTWRRDSPDATVELVLPVPLRAAAREGGLQVEVVHPAASAASWTTTERGTLELRVPQPWQVVTLARRPAR